MYNHNIASNTNKELYIGVVLCFVVPLFQRAAGDTIFFHNNGFENLHITIKRSGTAPRFRCLR